MNNCVDEVKSALSSIQSMGISLFYGLVSEVYRN